MASGDAESVLPVPMLFGVDPGEFLLGGPLGLEEYPCLR
jgi:hypothetical protein